jgi:hypothetical protein
MMRSAADGSFSLAWASARLCSTMIAQRDVAKERTLQRGKLPG